MLRFDLETYKKRPDLYPMVEGRRPYVGNQPIDHGYIIVGLKDGSWHAMPEEVYRKVRAEFYG